MPNLCGRVSAASRQVVAGRVAAAHQQSRGPSLLKARLSDFKIGHPMKPQAPSFQPLQAWHRGRPRYRRHLAQGTRDTRRNVGSDASIQRKRHICGPTLKNKSESLEGDLPPLLVGSSPRGLVVDWRHLGIKNDRPFRVHPSSAPFSKA